MLYKLNLIRSNIDINCRSAVSQYFAALLIYRLFVGQAYSCFEVDLHIIIVYLTLNYRDYHVTIHVAYNSDGNRPIGYT